VFLLPLEHVLSDVWGPTPLSVGKHAYYVRFIDDFSKFTWIYFLKKCSDVYQAFFIISSMLNVSLIGKLLLYQLIGGGEYEKLNSFFSKSWHHTHHVSSPHAHK
jgi:hypothetical protein